jgi:hypothetical protein
MKKQSVISSINVVRKAALRLGLCSVLVCNGLAPIQAQETKDGLLPVSISYVGQMNDRPLFKIEFENKSGVAYNISITDEDNNVLYSAKFKDKKFAKSFLVQDVDLEKMKLSFIITSNGEEAQVFDINQNIRTVQEYVITKR